MNRNSTAYYATADNREVKRLSRLDILKDQLNKLTPHQLAELRGAIDAKLDYQSTPVINEEERAFLRTLF